MKYYISAPTDDHSEQDEYLSSSKTVEKIAFFSLNSRHENGQHNSASLNAHQDIGIIADLFHASPVIAGRALKSPKQPVVHEMNQSIGQRQVSVAGLKHVPQ